MNLRELLAKASPARSGDELAGIAASGAEERVRAQMKLADVPLKAFLAEPVIPYETDEVTRLICDSHSAEALAPVSHLMWASSATGCFRSKRPQSGCGRWRPG
jgi:ethanolamine ammonia-lyase large subunit